MGYDELSFQPPQLLTTCELVLPEATLHLKLSRERWAACSILTSRAEIADTETVRLLGEMSPPHDFVVATGGLHAVPLGYAPASWLVTSLSEFLADTQPGDRWRGLIHFSPLGFSIYGRWTTDDAELLIQDARAAIVSAVFSLPRPEASDWLITLDRLAATVPIAIA